MAPFLPHYVVSLSFLCRIVIQIFRRAVTTMCHSTSRSLISHVIYQNLCSTHPQLQQLFPTKFPLEEENYTLVQVIIIETLCLEMIIMLGSRPMPPFLCQVVHYPPLEEEDEAKVREVSSPIHDTYYQHTKDVLDDTSSYNVDID